MGKNTKANNSQNPLSENTVAVITSPEGEVIVEPAVKTAQIDMFSDGDGKVEILTDNKGEIAVTSPSTSNVVIGKELAVIDEKQEEPEDNQEKKPKIRKLGAPKDDSKINKFDLFFIKLWSYIVSMVIAISSGINIVIKAIFKRKAPDKYVRACVAAILIIGVVLLFTLPFRINVSSQATVDIYGDGLIAVKQKVYDDTSGYPVYKWGYADKKGNVVIAPIYDEALPFRYGVAWVRLMVKNADGLTFKEDYWQLIDKKGKLKGGLKFSSDNNDFNSEKPVGEFQEGTKLAWVKKVGASGLYGYINTSGKIKIQYDFNYAENFSNGLARVKKGSAEFFINQNAKEVGDRYDEVRTFSNGLGAVKRSGLWGFINTKGKMTIDPSYDDVSKFVGDYAAVRREEAYGIIDKKGKLVIPPLEFMDIYTLSPEFRELIMSIHSK